MPPTARANTIVDGWLVTGDDIDDISIEFKVSNGNNEI